MKTIDFKRGVWNVRDSDTGEIKKFRVEAEAKAYAGVDDGSTKKEKGLEAETGWSDGVQQTKAYSESPEKKSYSSGEGWNKNKDDSFWAAGSKDSG